MRSGPLVGLRVVELAGLGPAPFCGMILADLGAEVIRVDRTDGETGSSGHDLLNRSKSSIAVNLKTREGVEVVIALAAQSAILIEGFRPGVAERLGVGPDHCFGVNPRLVYGRMTGWGQDGPLATTAGHDIDYIALSGTLHSIGEAERPVPPLNLVGDFGGGGMMLAMGVLAGVFAVSAGATRQVVDAAMVDGSALLASMQFSEMAAGRWEPRREANLLDGGAPFYTTYQTSDGHHMAVGALEPQFFEALLDGLSIEPSEIPPQADRDGWPLMREVFAERFAEGTREHWTNRFEGTDACVAPILSLSEAPKHPHNIERSTFLPFDEAVQPHPAPRFSATPTDLPQLPPAPGANTDSVMTGLGYSPDQVVMLRRAGAIA